jgi:hypothetical protein
VGVKEEGKKIPTQSSHHIISTELLNLQSNDQTLSPPTVPKNKYSATQRYYQNVAGQQIQQPIAHKKFGIRGAAISPRGTITENEKLKLNIE